MPAKLSVIVPFYNEEENVAALMARLCPVLEGIELEYEIIGVDDGSADRTLELLRAEASHREELVVINFDRNRGQHAAVIEGFRKARGDWLITLDGDLQNPPEEIPRLIAEFRKGHDLVATRRQDRQDPFLRRFASRGFNILLGAARSVPAQDLGCMLRGYTRTLALAIAETPGSGHFIPLDAYRHATNPSEIPVKHEPRRAGQSKYGAFRLLALALRLFRS